MKLFKNKTELRNYLKIKLNFLNHIENWFVKNK